MRIGTLKLKLQLVCGEAFALGPGKADVLDAIDRAGSISAAGRELGMSYRRIWLLVDEMNRCFRHRLVEAHAGGHDRGAQLTEAGQAALDAYRALETRAAALAEEPAYRALAALIREKPLDRQ